MRVLEHRRHSQRDPSGVHLSPEGVALAHRVGQNLGRFDRVLTSPKLRAVETAEALGFPVREVLPALGDMPDATATAGEEGDLRTFEDYVRAVAESPAGHAYATRQLSVWGDALSTVPEGGRVLMISHAGVIEFGAAAAVPDAARGWGGPLGYLEGVRLGWKDGRWMRADVLRV